MLVFGQVLVQRSQQQKVFFQFINRQSFEILQQVILVHLIFFHSHSIDRRYSTFVRPRSSATRSVTARRFAGKPICSTDLTAIGYSGSTIIGLSSDRGPHIGYDSYKLFSHHQEQRNEVLKQRVTKTTKETMTNNGTVCTMPSELILN